MDKLLITAVSKFGAYSMLEKELKEGFLVVSWGCGNWLEWTNCPLRAQSVFSFYHPENHIDVYTKMETEDEVDKEFLKFNFSPVEYEFYKDTYDLVQTPHVKIANILNAFS